MEKLIKGFYKERNLLIISSVFTALFIFFPINFEYLHLSYENSLITLLSLNTYYIIRLFHEWFKAKDYILKIVFPFMIGFVTIVYVVYELSNISLTWNTITLATVVILAIGEFAVSVLSLNAEYLVYRRPEAESLKSYLPKIPFAVASVFKYIPISIAVLIITGIIAQFFLGYPINSYWFVIILLPFSIHVLALGMYFILIDKEFIVHTLRILDKQDKEHILSSIGMKLSDKNSTSCRKTTTEQYQAVKHFLENGMDPNEIFENRYTLLLPSSCCGDYKFVRMLLDYGANINFQSKIGSTALILASKNNSKELVQLLIENGADVNIKDPQGKTALDYAKEGHFEEVVKILTCE